MKASQLPPPTEHQECVTFIDWTQRNFYKGRPLFDRIAHIPNERDVHRSKKSAGIHIAKLKEEGVKPGFFDYVVLAPLEPFGGLYLEAKRIRLSKTSDAQKTWLNDYIEFGYAAHICKGADELIARTQEYFNRYAAPGDWDWRVRMT